MADKTALGDANDDDEPKLTPEQREELRRAFSSPFQLQQFKLAESAFSSLNKTITSTALSGVAPALKIFAERQAELMAAMGGAVSVQARMEAVIAPVLEQARQFQAQMAQNLQVSILANEEFQNRISNLVVSSEFTDAMRRVRELSKVEFDIPSDDGFDRLAQMVETGEIDEETTAYAEQAIAQNEELSAAIDLAVDEFVKKRPLVPRWVVRRMLVTWVWLMYGGVLYIIAVMTHPAVAAIPSAVGAPGPVDVAKKAGKKFDEHYPPEAEGDASKDLES